MFSIIEAIKRGDENFEVYGIYSNPEEAKKVWVEMEKEADCLAGGVEHNINLKMLKSRLIKEDLGVLAVTIEKILKLHNNTLLSE